VLNEAVNFTPAKNQFKKTKGSSKKQAFCDAWMQKPQSANTPLKK